MINFVFIWGYYTIFLYFSNKQTHQQNSTILSFCLKSEELKLQFWQGLPSIKLQKQIYCASFMYCIKKWLLFNCFSHKLKKMGKCVIFNFCLVLFFLLSIFCSFWCLSATFFATVCNCFLPLSTYLCFVINFFNFLNFLFFPSFYNPEIASFFLRLNFDNLFLRRN